MIPPHPTDNPHLTDGPYWAKIESLDECTYGNDKNNLVRVVFWLPNVECHLVSHFYFPESQENLKSIYRLWHFCASVDLTGDDVEERPEVFQGRMLVIETFSALATDGGTGRVYSNVGRFLPASVALGMGEEQDDPDPCNSWSSWLGVEHGDEGGWI